MANDPRFDNIMLITGAARSGTSLTAGVIDICGAFGGITSSGNLNNPKGMFENACIRNDIIKPYLRSIGMDPLGQYPLPDVRKLSIPTDLRARIEQVFISQGYKGGPVYYKGAKMSLLWPLFHYAFPDAKWIIVRRRTGDITRSCCHTAFMRAFRFKENQKAVGAKNEVEGWTWWVNWHLDRFREMIDEGLNCKVVWPHRMVDGDYHQMYQTLDWLGLPWKSEVLSFIDPKLYKSRRRSDGKIGDEGMDTIGDDKSTVGNQEQGTV